MGKFVFYRYTTTSYKVDPIFNSAEFYLNGTPAVYNAPELFDVGPYRYVLINPEDFKFNKEFCFKIATYLYYHPTQDSNGLPYTYFFGDINDCKDIGDGFSNQICKYVSYEMIDEWYPKNLTEINDYVVNFFLAQQRYYGQEFFFKDYNINYLLFISTNLTQHEQMQSKSFILSQLVKSGYFRADKSGDTYLSITMTEKAIESFQITKEKGNGNTAFIAIKFNNNEERIKAIQDAIAESGYEPIIMTEYQTNDWIMPEIFHQIQLSKFVVVDFSLRCDGAYYEAGYAHAIGKQVIHIYDKREEQNNPLHFDVAQKSTVMYENYNDLKHKLKNRINATVN